MDELKNIAPKLSKIKKENPYGTPPRYFDDFAARLQTKIAEEENPVKDKKPRIIQLLKPALGLAASFALIFMLVYVPLKKFSATDNIAVTENSEYSDSDSDFLNVLEDLDESSFFALLEEEDEATTDFTDDELVLYVNANFTDYEIYEYTKN